MWAGVAPGDAANELIRGALGTEGAWSGTLKETTPLLLAGLAVFVALRAGLFNIGVEGQLIVGAMTCAIVGLRLPGVFGLVLGIVAGAAAGSLWALPAGMIKAYRGGHEVITTIMLNNVALFFTGWMVAGPIKAPGQQNTTTPDLEPGTLLPTLYSDPPLRISSSLLIGLLLLAAFALWLKRTVAGYELSLVGANPRAAEFAGVDAKRTVVRAMAASGAIAGLAGALMVLGYEGRFYAGFSPGYGFDALGVALLAGSQPLAIIPSALAFGILNKGSAAVQLIGVPKGVTYVVLGLVILVFAAIRYRRTAVDE
jgi:simple sugar transport system permease protein